MVNALIFLGAGASAPFGIPTMKEMVPAFEQYLNDLSGNFPLKYNMIGLYRSIQSILSSAYGYVDLESMFSVIDAIANETKHSELGYIAMYVISRMRSNISNLPISNTDEQKAAKNLLDQFKKFIRIKCTLDDSKSDMIDEVYRDFFEVLGNKFGIGVNVAHNGKPYRTAPWQIYTTDYDTCIESFWEGVATINDLFDENRGLKVLGVNNIKHLDQTIKVVKLHGSIDWYKLGIWRIAKSSSMRGKVGKEPVQAEEMLYPIQQKDLYLYPWISFIAGLKEDLQRLRNWIVIGYSFNDEFILNIFKELLSADKNYNLVIVDPRATQIIWQKFPEFNERVKPVIGYFGQQGTNQSIVDKLV